ERPAVEGVAPDQRPREEGGGALREYRGLRQRDGLAQGVRGAGVVPVAHRGGLRPGHVALLRRGHPRPAADVRVDRRRGAAEAEEEEGEDEEQRATHRDLQRGPEGGPPSHGGDLPRPSLEVSKAGGRVLRRSLKIFKK